MAEELLVRSIYGLSLTVHNFFANIPLGIAVVHCCLVVYKYNNGWKDALPSVRLIFDFLVITVMLSVFAGFALEIEFVRFWPKFAATLESWNHHPGHKSAVISFFISSFIIIATYKFELWKNKSLYLVLSLIWVLLAWSFSVWGIFLNTVMQNPYDAVLENGVLLLNGSIADRFLSGYHLARQSHIALASVLKAAVIILLLSSWLNKVAYKANYRFITLIILFTLFGAGLTGHFQAVNISEHQPSKFAAMEGIQSPADTINWKAIGFMSPDGSILSVPINGGLQQLTNGKLLSLQEIPTEEQPSIFLSFNSFRLMLYSFTLIFVLVVAWGLRKKKVTTTGLILLLILVELAINSGWILSETGRQPWMYYGLLKRTYVEVGLVSISIIGLILNTILLGTTTIMGLKFLKEHHQFKTTA